MLNFKKKLVENGHKKLTLDDSIIIVNPNIDPLIQEHLLTSSDLMSDAIKFYKDNPGDTTTVAQVNLCNRQFVVKRYNHKSWLHALKLQFRQSHAFRSFWFADYLSGLGIATLTPIAAIQRKKFFFKKEAFFISEDLSGINGSDYFNPQTRPELKTNWPSIIAKIATLFKTLKKNKIYHGDFHFGNLVIVDAEPYLLDFDRIKIIRSPKQFSRLNKKDSDNFYRYVNRCKELVPYCIGKLS